MPRWDPYFIAPDFDAFWRQRTKEASSRTLLILTLGFDPRCIQVAVMLDNMGIGERLELLALQLSANPAFDQQGGPLEDLLESNIASLRELETRHSAKIIQIETHDNDGHSITGRRALDAISKSKNDFSRYTDVIVDISGMPKAALFPIVSYLIYLADEGTIANLHISLVEDPLLEGSIIGQEFGQADFLHTFRPKANSTFVWLPSLGLHQETRLAKIYDLLQPSCVEICPILPFPSRSMRLVDDLALDHSELLFETFGVSLDNLILCDERTPFDAYRKVLELDEYYKTRIALLTGNELITTVVSPLASKMQSLGVLLAAKEKGLPVCHVEPGTYRLELDDDGRLPTAGNSPTEIWITGEPYSVV